VQRGLLLPPYGNAQQSAAVVHGSGGMRQQVAPFSQSDGLQHWLLSLHVLPPLLHAVHAPLSQ
jgi:hypothetical protein